ncbi:MAG TPA: hypothetical protein DCY40_08205 [Actinobacteria bacterium]|nr:hypothetical protein [Actinomycetota bacterium]
MTTQVIPSVDRSRLGALLAITEAPRVSVVMPVNHLDPQHDAIRARGLGARLRVLLEPHAVDQAVADHLLATVEERFGHLHPIPHAIGAVALYATPSGSEWLLLPVRIRETVTVAEEFHLLPVIDAVDPAHCFVLTLARGGNALWRANRWSVEPVTLPGAPGALSEITRFRELEKQLQFHQSARGGAAVFHGHALGENREMEPVRAYLRRVDQALGAALAGDTAPVLLVGPGSLPGMFRDISTHNRIVDHPIEIHPDGVDASHLHEFARPVVDALVADRTQRFLDRVGMLREPRRSSTLSAEIVVAAALGRVDTMLFDPDADNCGVVNRAAVAALRHAATVLSAPGLPTGAAATYRW